MPFGSALPVLPYFDRSLGALPYPNYRSYQTDSDSEGFPRRLGHGSTSPPSNIALRLQDPDLKSDKCLGWSIEWAVAFLVDFLDEKNSPGAANALRNIRIRAAALEKDGLAAEIPFRIFNKLDETLFAGHLKNAVRLDVDHVGQNVSGATHAQGGETNPELKRTTIVLNGDILQHARAKDVVAILIHHMIHAYFLVACGPQNKEEVEYGRLNHGIHFGKIMMTIKKLSAVHGKVLKPLGFGHCLGPTRYIPDDYFYPGPNPFHTHRSKEAWHHSHCYFDTPSISESDVDSWYTKICAPLLDQPKIVRKATVHVYNDSKHELESVPRGITTPTTKSVELLFKKDKSVLIPDDKIDSGGFLSIRKAFDKEKCRFVTVHKETSEKTFLRLIEFIHTGLCRPDPLSFAGLASVARRKGPPIIKPSLSSSTDPYLLNDIQFYRLGTQMEFSEVKSYALARLNAYSIMCEDPIAVLKEIYADGEPDPDLKSWARKFLIKCPGEWVSGGGGCASADIPYTNEPPNLIKLESEHWPYRARLFDLMDASGSLENDVRKARTELKSMGWYAVSAPPVAQGMAAWSAGITMPAHPTLVATPPPSLSHPVPALGTPMGYGVLPGRLGSPPVNWPWMNMFGAGGVRKGHAGMAAEPYGRGLGYGDYGDGQWGW